MRIFLSPLPDGAIRMLSSLAPPDHGRVDLVSPKGEPLCGLPYDEAIQYASIDTNDAGEFITGEKRLPVASDQVFAIPEFLRYPSDAALWLVGRPASILPGALNHPARRMLRTRP